VNDIKDLMNKNGDETPAPPPTEVKKTAFEIKVARRKQRQRILLAIIAAIAVVMAVAVGFAVLRAKATVKTKVTQAKTNAKAKTSINNIGATPNHIIIARLGIDEPIYDDTEPGPLLQDDLLKGATYYDETSNKPGHGNTVIFAHSAVTAAHGAPFGKIGDGELNVGDEVVVTDATKKQFVYIVKEINTIDATDFSVLKPLGKDEPPILTLVTCIGPNYPRDKRLAVIAVLKT